MKIGRDDTPIGWVFGRLTVLKQAPHNPNISGRLWQCKCECGSKKIARSSDLNSGNVSSCGCAVEDNGREPVHGYAKYPEYHVWWDMINRCSNIDNENYGGRGITVSPRWVKDFMNFYKDMGPRPGAGFELDRRNNDKGYTKGNCRWVTHRKNSNNRRDTIRLKCRGRTQSLSEWAEEIGVSHDTLYNRYRKGSDAAINFIKEKL